MRVLRHVLCAVAGAAFATVATSQGLALRVTTPTGVVVNANQAMDSVPPATDLTGGRVLQAIDGSTSADVRFTSIHGPMQSSVACDANLIAAATPMFGNIAYLRQHTVTMAWSSPSPVFGRLRVEWCRTGNFDGSITVSGYGSTNLPPVPISCQTPYANEYLVMVDAAGLALQIDAYGVALSGRFAVQTIGRWHVRLTLDPTVPCAAQPFGTACGPRLYVETDALLPHRVRLRIEETSPIAAAVLLVGVQRLQLTLPGGCFLHNEMLVTLPLAAQNTTAATQLDPNPYPGLRVTVQGYTLPAVNPTLRLTEGFELFCR